MVVSIAVIAAVLLFGIEGLQKLFGARTLMPWHLRQFRRSQPLKLPSWPSVRISGFCIQVGSKGCMVVSCLNAKTRREIFFTRFAAARLIGHLKEISFRASPATGRFHSGRNSTIFKTDRNFSPLSD
jgi:hypothetical protein